MKIDIIEYSSVKDEALRKSVLEKNGRNRD